MPAHLAAVPGIAEALELARTDPDELRRRIRGTKDPKARQLLLRGLFAFLADKLTPQDAIKEALLFEEADRDTALKELAAVWLGVSPESIKAGTGETSAVLQAGLALIRSPDARPGSVEAWMQAFKNHSARLELVSSLAAKLTASDPARAIALADGLTEWERQRFFDKVLVAWAARDPGAARQWMTDPANAGDAADRRFLWNTASYAQPEWVLSALEAEQDPAIRLDIVRGMATKLALNGTREALTWADSLTNPAERDAAHERIYEETPRGIGAVLGTADGYPLVRSTLPESAAARAGIQAGDRLVEVTGNDGKPVALYQQPLETALNHLRGEAGETVTIRLLRGASNGEIAEHTLRVTRDQIILPPEFARTEGK
jgi:hypothetical protein